VAVLGRFKVLYPFLNVLNKTTKTSYLLAALLRIELLIRGIISTYLWEQHPIFVP
jgi:hypothetical protein